MLLTVWQIPEIGLAQSAQYVWFARFLLSKFRFVIERFNKVQPATVTCALVCVLLNSAKGRAYTHYVEESYYKVEIQQVLILFLFIHRQQPLYNIKQS